MNWRTWGRTAFALLLVASLSLILVHWHLDSRGQDCGVCHAQQMPRLENATKVLAPVPPTQEWIERTAQAANFHSGFVPTQPGRAPPQNSFAA